MDDTEKHWKDIVEENINDKGKFHEIMWEVYMKEREGLIKRGFPVEVLHQKRGKIVWTCVEDNIIKEKVKNR